MPYAPSILFDKMNLFFKNFFRETNSHLILIKIFDVKNLIGDNEANIFEMYE